MEIIHGKEKQSPAGIAPGKESTQKPSFGKGYNEIFVTPDSFLAHGGRNHMFILKVTNNKDIPLYDVYVQLEITNGDLTAKQIEIERLEARAVETKLGDEKSGIIVDWDVYFKNIIPPGKKILL